MHNLFAKNNNYDPKVFFNTPDRRENVISQPKSYLVYDSKCYNTLMAVYTQLFHTILAGISIAWQSKLGKENKRGSNPDEVIGVFSI